MERASAGAVGVLPLAPLGLLSIVYQFHHLGINFGTTKTFTLGRSWSALARALSASCLSRHSDSCPSSTNFTTWALISELLSSLPILTAMYGGHVDFAGSKNRPLLGEVLNHLSGGDYKR